MVMKGSWPVSRNNVRVISNVFMPFCPVALKTTDLAWSMG